MKRKNYILYNFCIFFLVSSSFISSVLAGFKIGDTSVSVDEGDFLEYDFDDNIASGPLRIKVVFTHIFQYEDIISSLAINVTLMIFNSSSNTYKVLIMDNIEFQNKICMFSNKTHQFFRYEQSMDNLVMHGYGGYFIIPNDPVDLYVIKGYVENYTAWSANVINNTITVDIANIQAVLTYNQQGILIKEEIKSNELMVSTLTLIEPDDKDDSNFVLFISIIVIIVVAVVLIPIGIIFHKRSK